MEGCYRVVREVPQMADDDQTKTDEQLEPAAEEAAAAEPAAEVTEDQPAAEPVVDDAA